MKNWLLSFVYALIRFSAGLLLHPYQTMQLLVEQKLFLWVTLFPTLMLALLTLLWKIVALPILAIILFPIEVADCWLLSFVSTWLTLFMVYWQLMLFYLMVRFKFALEQD